MFACCMVGKCKLHVSDSGRIQTQGKRAALTVHLNDLVQVGQDGSKFSGGQELFFLQRLRKDRLKNTQHSHMGMFCCKQLWEGKESGNSMSKDLAAYTANLILSAHLLSSSLLSSPLMTSCLLVSFLERLDRASGEASSLQLGGSCSNSRRRGSISSICGEGLVGEWPGPSGTKTGPSKLKDEGSSRRISLDW